jgi:hypothetical protein
LFRKFKLPNHQNGQVYLTSHRICYVDKAEPRKHSVALDLKDVDRFEFYVCRRFTKGQSTGVLVIADLGFAGRLSQVIS